MKYRLIPAMFLAVFFLVNSTFAESIEVKTEREKGGDVIHVQVNMSLPFKNNEVMSVLDDYEHMPQFVPDIKEIHIISSDADFKVVQIIGASTLMFLTYPIDVVMEVKNLSTTKISLKTLSGNLKVAGTVEVTPEDTGTKVSYIADLQPTFWLPPVLGPYIIGLQIRRQFEGKVTEMHRRYDYTTPPQGVGH